MKQVIYAIIVISGLLFMIQVLEMYQTDYEDMKFGNFIEKLNRS